MHRRFVFHAGCALALMLCASAAHAARLGLVHLSPTAGEVRLVSGDVPVAENVAYRDYILDLFADHTPAPTGDVSLQAIATDGSVLAQATFDILPNDEALVSLVGNGSALAPYALVRSYDHNYQFGPGAVSLQSGNAAIGGVDANGALEQVVSQFDCDTDIGADTDISLRYLDGLASPRNLGSLRSASGCVLTASIGNNSFSATFDMQPNDRLRIVFIGDGATQPYEALVLRQRPLDALPHMAADASIDGLWFSPAIAAEGISLTFVPPAGGSTMGTVRGVHYGYNAGGDAEWTLFDGDTQYRYVGGSLDGIAPTVRYTQKHYWIEFHNCREATLVITAGPGNAPVFDTRPNPRNAVRLHKLLPTTPCDAGVTP